MVVLNGYTVIRKALLDRRHEFAGRFPAKMGELYTLGCRFIRQHAFKYRAMTNDIFFSQSQMRELMAGVSKRDTLVHR
ncbi:hypothetical protein HPB48_008677 [Haemaphysalis longicornis]|uniref:Uncharacterized protein n=1 Tax=Haemaphysalis longicornis TaxID=44386 RepID=A0A9J6G5R6_HAELO|nr:hypothetical protein HPB48_008677 [Haemaphysalis longicornis]